MRLSEVGEDEGSNPVGDADLHHHSVSGVVDVDFALFEDARVVCQLQLLGGVGGGRGGAGLMLDFLRQLLRQALRLLVLGQGWEVSGCSVAV